MCKKDLGNRPHEIILQHRAEGILVYPLCSDGMCWEQMGMKMKKGMR